MPARKKARRKAGRRRAARPPAKREKAPEPDAAVVLRCPECGYIFAAGDPMQGVTTIFEPGVLATGIRCRGTVGVHAIPCNAIIDPRAK